MKILGAVFSPNGRLFATGSSDGLVKIWETSTRREIVALPVSLSSVQSLAFSPNGRRLAAGDTGGTVTLFDLATFQPIAHFQGHSDPSIVWLAFWPDGMTLASVSLKAIVIRRTAIESRANNRIMPTGSSGFERRWLETGDSPLRPSRLCGGCNGSTFGSFAYFAWFAVLCAPFP
jgi:WD40 repeat protein